MQNILVYLIYDEMFQLQSRCKLYIEQKNRVVFIAASWCLASRLTQLDTGCSVLFYWTDILLLNCFGKCNKYLLSCVGVLKQLRHSHLKLSHVSAWQFISEVHEYQVCVNVLTVIDKYACMHVDSTEAWRHGGITGNFHSDTKHI